MDKEKDKTNKGKQKQEVKNIYAEIAREYIRQNQKEGSIVKK